MATKKIKIVSPAKAKKNAFLQSLLSKLQKQTVPKFKVSLLGKYKNLSKVKQKV